MSCTSELSSALPFAGGAYGLARCTLGFYPGYVVGCCESIEYIIYVSLSTLFIGQLLSTFFNTPTELQPVWWLVFYVTAIALQLNGKLFWLFNALLAFLSITILIVYMFGSLKYVDINVYGRSANTGTTADYFVGGGSTFMLAFPLSAWLYVGVETLAFTSDLVSDPRKTIPAANMSCVCTLFICGIIVLFVCACLRRASLMQLWRSSR
jgi:amino acid transporter